MTDRLKGCWVAFDRDIRDDDAEALLNAIRMLRGVADVSTSVASSADWMARRQVRSQVLGKIIDAVQAVLDSES